MVDDVIAIAQLLHAWYQYLAGHFKLDCTCEAQWVALEYIEIMLSFHNREDVKITVTSARAEKPRGALLSDTLPMMIGFEVERMGPVAREIILNLDVSSGGKRYARLHSIPPVGWRKKGWFRVALDLRMDSAKARHGRLRIPRKSQPGPPPSIA